MAGRGMWLLRAIAVALCVQGAPAHAALPDGARFGNAMELGDIRAAERWLEEGLDPNFEADALGTGLMIGAWEGNIALMELFLNRGADINHVSRIGEQALMLAAWSGRLEAVRWLVERGADVNRANKQWTALHYATFNGHEEIVRYLMSKGADINARTTNDSTALMLTAREGHEKLTQLLLQAGADPRPANDWGDTAFTWAMGHRNLRIARLVSAALDATPGDAVPPTFAEAAKTPPDAFPNPGGSVAPPSPIAEIMEKLRAAELQGRPTRELRQTLFEAVARFKSGNPLPVAQKAGAKASARQTAPRALVVTAKRASAGAERAELVYDKDKPSPIATTESGSVGDILARLRAAEAKGEPVGPLREALFAAVARHKGERPALAESQGRPLEVVEILQQLRDAEAAGRPAGELRKALRDAVERHKRESAPTDGP